MPAATDTTAHTDHHENRDHTPEEDTGENTTGLARRVIHFVTPRENRLTAEEQRVLIAGCDAQLRWELDVDRIIKARRLPYALTTVTGTLGTVAWALGESSGNALIIAPVVGTLTLGATAVIQYAKRTVITEAWRRRVWTAGTVSALWVALQAIAPIPGAVFVMLGTLFVLQYVLSRGWRQQHPIPTGTRIEDLAAAEFTPEPEPVLDDEVARRYAQAWETHIAASNGPLPGSALTEGETTPHAVQYTLQLVPAKQHIKKVRAALDEVSSGLGIKPENILPEAHPTYDDPAKLRLTLVLNSPVKQARMWAGPHLQTNEEGTKCSIPVGRYADGLGDAQWELWRSSGMRNGLLIGGTRSGKGGLSGVLMTSARATGRINTIYVDPQGGMSSPGVGLNCRVSVCGQEAADRAIDVVEALAQAREQAGGINKKGKSRKEMFANAVSKFMPTPQQPGWVVLVDECSMIFPQQAEAWGNLAARCLKLGICIIAMTQNSGLEALGSNRLRSALTQNYIALKMDSRMDGNLIPGLPADPHDLPDMAGFGYFKGDERSGVSFRGDWLPEEDDAGLFTERPPWMLREAMEAHPEPAVCDMDYQALANIIGEPDEDGVWTVVGDESFLDDEDEDGVVTRTATADTSTSPSKLPSMNLPPMPKPVLQKPLQLTESDQKALDAVRAGKRRTKSILTETGLSNAQLHRVLPKLEAHGLIHSPQRGHWKLVGPADSEQEQEAVAV